jgi:hypothetical protein
MRIMLFFLCLCLLSVPSVSALNTQSKAEISSNQYDFVVETFQPQTGLVQHSINTSSVPLNWWLWSDETGSNWPDDDAIARTETLSIERNDALKSGGATRINTQAHVPTPNLKLVEITGTVSTALVEEGEIVLFDVAITPKINLSQTTIMYLVLSKDYAIDQHGRHMEHLVMEWKPEIGFSSMSGNTTSRQYLIEPEHLRAAGVDFDSQPSGWSYTIIVFGYPEGENETQLLSLYHGQIPDPVTMEDSSSLVFPLLIIVVTAILFAGVVQSARRRDQLIPKLTAHWQEGEGHVLMLSMTNGASPANVLSWSLDPPWQFKQRPSNFNLRTGEEKTVKLTFKDHQTTHCRISIRLDIDSLGIWKQQLSIEPQEQPQSEATKS